MDMEEHDGFSMLPTTRFLPSTLNALSNLKYNY